MQQTTDGHERVKLSTIFLYNGAGFSFNLYDTVLYAWLPYFYSPPTGSGRTVYVPLALFGLILAGGRILDAVSDPLIGYLSDKSRSRWGRRKPFIAISGPLLFITFILVWHPPVDGISGWNAFFLALVLFVYYWAYTGFLIPWLSNVPEITRSNTERMRILSFGVVIGTIGALVGGGLSGPVIESSGPFGMALILGCVAFLTGELTLFGIQENYTPPAGEERGQGFFKTMAMVFKDKQVLSFSGMILFVQITYQLMLMNVPYMTTLILEETEASSSILMGEVIILMAVSIPLWYFLLKKYPKRRIMRIIIVLMTFGFLASFFVGHLGFLSKMAQAMVILPLAAIPLGGMFNASLGLIADLTDYGEWKDGTRNEAVYYGIYGIVRKTGWAFCSLILTAVFSFFGYSAANPMGVRIIWIICAASCLLGLILFIPYRLGDSRDESARIMGSR